MFRSFARALRPLSNAYTRGLPRPMPRLLSRTPMGLLAGNYKAPSIQTRPARNPATSFKTRLALPTPGSFGAFASGSGGSGRAGEDVPRWVLGSGLGLVAFFSGDDAHKKTDQILHERGLRQLLKKHGWARKIKLGSIVGLGVNLNEELHPETSSRVKDDPIRQKTTEKMKAAGSEVVWLEASGLLEMGAYVGATIPVGIFGDGTVGFDSKGLIEYRFMSPISAEAQNKGAREVHGGTLLLPTTREELLGIHPGSEFEIRGYGKMSGRALTSVGRRSFIPGIGASTVASVGGNALWEGNLILKVKVLDDQGKVEMFVIRDENKTGRIEARLNASLGLDPTSMPTLGKGYLGVLARKKGEKAISSCLKRFGRADFNAYWQDTSRENGMGRYVLDIRTPDGLCAYTSLLGLEVDKAESLS
ncbi:MAG: hypothetical protein VYA34_17060, partial [Myxococcota bacterium]|nr:hypothetical protein [Myxococcota bacterium]